MNRSKTTSWVKVLAGTAALTLTLAACGSNDDPEAEDNPSGSESTSETPSESAATETFAAAKCKSETSADAFRVGGILPLTGNLAFLGPPEIAGVGLAVSDINAAGGVGGAMSCTDVQDSGDSTDMSVSTASAGALVASKPSVVIGAASSSVSLNVVDTFADNKIVEVSPANTAADLSGYSPYYFRTAPEDSVQGGVLGSLVSQDGYQKLAFLVFNDTYGTGLRNFTQAAFEGAGGECVYGCKGDGDEFPAGQTTFSAEVTAALASNPDAIVVLAFDETKAIVPELAAQGWDMSKTYYTDGNTSDYSADLEPGTLEGAQGTIPGADPDAAFKGRLDAYSDAGRGREADQLLLRCRVVRRGHAGGPGRGQGWRHLLRDGAEELRCRVGCHRWRGVQHLRGLRRTPRGRPGDLLQGSVGHRSDQRPERPVVGLRRHLPVRR